MAFVKFPFPEALAMLIPPMLVNSLMSTSRFIANLLFLVRWNLYRLWLVLMLVPVKRLVLGPAIWPVPPVLAAIRTVWQLLPVRLPIRAMWPVLILTMAIGTEMLLLAKTWATFIPPLIKLTTALIL